MCGSRSNSNRGGVAIRHGDDVFYWENSYFVSPNVFDLFPVKVIYGDPKTALKEQGTIAVSETFAHKYFGNANPMGETIVTDGGVAQKINLVFADQPQNTHLKYDILWSDNLPFLRDSDNPSQRRQQLFGIGIYTYLLMAPGFKPADWARINDDFWKRNMEEIGKAFKAEWHSWLQPLADVHLQTEVQDHAAHRQPHLPLWLCRGGAVHPVGGLHQLHEPGHGTRHTPRPVGGHPQDPRRQPRLAGNPVPG